MANAYWPGNIARISVIFRDEAGNPRTGTTVTLRIKNPELAAEVRTLALGGVIEDGPGTFHSDVALTNSPGLWEYRWESTGNPTAAIDGELQVLTSDLAA